MNHPLISAIRRAGVIATLRALTAEAAIQSVEALVRGGITAIEVTYSTPGAGAVIAELRARYGENILLGTGTLTTVAQVEESVDSGASFLVSPGYDPEVAEAIATTDCLSMIGAFTATEGQNLVKRGVDIVKFFPGSIGGPGALRALRGPFPDLNFVPTGGVSATNLGEWLAAGAIAVGAGSELVSRVAMANGDFGRIEASARAFISLLDAART